MDITQPATARPARLTALASRRVSLLALAAILALAALLRLHAIGAASLWLDEAWSWTEVREPFLTMIARTADDIHPPLYNSILYLFARVFGDSEVALRWPSAILGVASVAAIFWVASSLGGRLAGLLAAALLCLSGFHVEQSQDARPYTLFTLTAILFAGATFRALETDRRIWHVASAIGALLLLYTHAYGGLLWLSVAAAVGASAKAWGDPDRKVLLHWVVGQAIAGLLFLPWAFILARHYHAIVVRGFWVQRPTPEFLLQLVKDLASGGPLAVALLAGTIVALAPSRMFAARTQAPEEVHSHEALRRAICLAWLLGPLVIGLALSVISQPILFDRYVICSLPAWLILASIGLCRIGQVGGRVVLAGGLALTVAGALASFCTYWTTQHEDARGTVKAYLDAAAPSDCVFAIDPIVTMEVYYYLRNRPPCLRVTAAPEDVTPWAAPSPRSWLFLGYINRKTRDAVDENLKAHGWRAKPVISNPSVSLLELEPAS